MGVLLVIAIPIGFILFIQLMSKISGKRIVGKYSGQTMGSPTDFDESVETIKKASENLNFYIKKFKLDNVEQVVYKLDKVLNKAPGIKFRDYFVNKIRFENLINTIVAEGKISQKELLQSMNLPGILVDGIVDNETYEKLRRYRITYQVDLQTFNQADLDKIQSFMLPVFNNDYDTLIDFLDLLGRPNFKEFAAVIDLMEKMYLSSKITKEEINNIKLLILRKKGMLDTII